MTQFRTGKFHVFAGEIMLQAGGSKITMGASGIKIESGGDVEVNGAVIKLNC